MRPRIPARSGSGRSGRRTRPSGEAAYCAVSSRTASASAAAVRSPKRRVNLPGADNATTQGRLHWLMQRTPRRETPLRAASLFSKRDLMRWARRYPGRSRSSGSSSLLRHLVHTDKVAHSFACIGCSFPWKGRHAGGANWMYQMNSWQMPVRNLLSSPYLLGAPRPSVVNGVMAGLLTCGSKLACTFPGCWQSPGPVVFDRFALRLQLRGQSRNWRLMAKPDRVPFCIPCASFGTWKPSISFKPFRGRKSIAFRLRREHSSKENRVDRLDVFPVTGDLEQA